MKIKILTFLCCFVFGTLVVVYLAEKHLSETPLINIESPINEYESPLIVEINELNRDLDELYKSDEEREIWSGESAGHKIRWTNKDIYIDSKNSTHKIFSSFAKKLYENDHKAEIAEHKKYVLNRFENGEISDRDFKHFYRLSERIISGKIVSAFGPLLTVEIMETSFGAGVYSSSYWIVYDLRQPNFKLAEQFYIDHRGRRQIGSHLGESVRLTEFFKDSDILRAFLESSEIRQAIDTVDPTFKPKTTSELFRWFHHKDDLFLPAGEKGIILELEKKGGLGFRSLSGFVVKRIENNFVILDVGLEPVYRYDGVPTVEIKLPLTQRFAKFMGKEALENRIIALDSAAESSIPYWGTEYICR